MRARGFTLIEVLVALAIFAVLGLASWQVMHQMITTRQTLSQHSDQLREVQRCMWIITQDLRSVVDRPVKDNQGAPEPAISSLIPGYRLTFTRNGWLNPLQERRSELQRVAYGLETLDGHTQLVRYRWAMLDRAPDAEPAREMLLQSIDRLEIQFVDHQGQTHFYWPPSENTSTPNQHNAIPSGIRLYLSTPDWGDVTRVIQLRDVERS